MIYSVLFITFIIAVASVALGWSLGSESAARKITGIDIEALKERAFQEAKREYCDWFKKRFSDDVCGLENAIMKENKQLKIQVELLKKELMEERKKNEGTGSN